MPGTQQSPEPDNRAARRQRARRKQEAASTAGARKARDTGRHNAVQGPRHWSVRRSG